MRKNIKQVVENILNGFQDLQLPINIESIAKSRGLLIKPYPLGNDVSGLLAIENGKAVIGVNHTESRVRRRFTIAHELGHYELHREEGKLFIDKDFKMFRSQTSGNTPHNQKLEQEANTFAASILMPEYLVKVEAEKLAFDVGSEEAIQILSKKFDVSTTAMCIRLANLGILE